MKKIEVNLYPNDWKQPFTIYQANYPANFKTPTVRLTPEPTPLIKEPYSITIEATTSNEAITLAKSFHDQLETNKDYMDARITITIALNTVRLYVFKESRTFIGLRKTYD